MNRFVAETELKNYSVVSIVLLLTQTWQTRKDMYTSVTTKVTKVARLQALLGRKSKVMIIPLSGYRNPVVMVTNNIYSSLQH